jgi:exosome complex RNA-binding protein Rrp4
VSVDDVQGTARYVEPRVQEVQPEQTVSAVAEQAETTKLEPGQMVHVVHLRSDEAVGAVDWYWLELQVVSAAQTRFEVAVGGSNSNCVERQMVSAVQTRSVVAVGATDWY